MILNINSKAAVTFTNTLEKMRRSALPLAIRNTLNSAAFDVKKNTMPKSADKNFVLRAPNFFKANSSVQMARGWDLDKMQSVVGFIGKGTSDKAVKDLEQQEYGGTIKDRSFIPLAQARGGSDEKTVRPRFRLSSVKKVINANTMEGKTPQQKFHAAIKKAGEGGYVIGSNEKQTLFKVEKIFPKVRLKPLYSYKKNRSVQVGGTRFMRDASLESGNKMDVYYAKEARKQIEKLQ